ncbi:TonB family protein [Luteimonas sp. 3794]|nr:TonB family protein [Luteimonas sp. 3794]
MQTLEASQTESGCRIEGIAPTADIAALQQRALALIAEANCAARATPGEVGAVGSGADAGHGFTLTLAAPPGGGVCLQSPGATPPSPQTGLDMMSRHEHPAVHPGTAGRGGVAMVVVLVDPDQSPVVSLISRSSGHPALDTAALEASQRWTYTRMDTPREPGIGLVLVPVPFEVE